MVKEVAVTLGSVSWKYACQSVSEDILCDLRGCYDPFFSVEVPSEAVNCPESKILLPQLEFQVFIFLSSPPPQKITLPPSPTRYTQYPQDCSSVSPVVQTRLFGEGKKNQDLNRKSINAFEVSGKLVFSSSMHSNVNKAN